MSTTTFLIIYTPFEIYWSFRDIYFDRWIPVRYNNLKTSKIKIEVEQGKKGKSKCLGGLLISFGENNKDRSKDTIVIVCHGFSDKKETLEYYYLPLAYQGYTILVYDARGTGESKKVGKRSQFIKRIDDFKKIVCWIEKNNELKSYKIYAVGFSIGAITVLCGGFSSEKIKKIIAISSMSYYKQNLPKYNLIVMLSYLMKGVKLFPNKKENEELSPYIVIEQFKSLISDEEWDYYSRRVFLIHARNDRIIKFKNFKENVTLLGITEKNTLILKKGGHTQKKNELLLVAASLAFFNT
ncbi:MAG: alpha/beta fold hydrolase [Candidatus Lokiarchaeota archaeon]|nr:alpha/beta fold hydrolase [Candidatus Lokiarchaeota archaeon]